MNQLTSSLELKKRYEAVCSRIAAACDKSGRDPAEVQLVAVSKTHSAEKIRALYELVGHRDFGENYAQELFVKQEALRELPLCWHFIGALQSNKIRKLLDRTDVLHTLCSIDHAKKIFAASDDLKLTRAVEIYVQIKTETENSRKSGISLDECGHFVDQFSQLSQEYRTNKVGLSGLMAIPEANISHGVQHQYKLLGQYAKKVGAGKLSLGMSDDLELAIDSGSTCLRIGTAIFGPRVIP